METRRFLLAIVLSVLVLVTWQLIYRPEPPQEPPSTPADVPSLTVEEAATPTPPEAELEEPAPPAEVIEEQVTEERAAAEERVVVDAPRFRAEFTNRGAQLISYRLKEHPSSDGGVVDLVRARVQSPYPFSLRTTAGGPSPLNDRLFLVDRTPDPEGRQAVEFRYAGDEGRARKRFVFREDGMFDLEVEVPDGGEIVLGPGIRNPDEEELKNRFSRRTAIYRTVEDLERVDPQRVDEPRLIPGAGLRWLGIQDTYFLTALVLTTPVQQASLEPLLAEPQTEGTARFRTVPPGGELSREQKDLTRELLAAVRPSQGRLTGVCYFGPKDFDLLSSLPYGLEESVNLGVFGFLSRPLLFGLRWIHDNVVSNYGWAIILMTIVIRLVLFPLTHKSFVSMQKMQKLNPQLQAIRQKYRPKLKDKQGRANPEMQRKMNEEIMGLYKKEGVNPAGGCLPMLMQIPVLFAFYSLLSTAIELRYAPWIFWIQDLASKDPYYALPIIMGGSQFIQQKLTPSSADPMQRRIFMLMPIFFTVLFLGFPSGLVLYWLTNNVLGIAQQAGYKKLQERKGAEGKKAKKETESKPKKKARGR